VKNNSMVCMTDQGIISVEFSRGITLAISYSLVPGFNVDLNFSVSYRYEKTPCREHPGDRRHSHGPWL
jgi:hypothetical protein